MFHEYIYALIVSLTESFCEENNRCYPTLLQSVSIHTFGSEAKTNRPPPQMNFNLHSLFLENKLARGWLVFAGAKGMYAKLIA